LWVSDRGKPPGIYEKMPFKKEGSQKRKNL
jgi:hypothetical protein